jgi:hypothetical protein
MYIRGDISNRGVGSIWMIPCNAGEQAEPTDAIKEGPAMTDPVEMAAEFFKNSLRLVLYFIVRLDLGIEKLQKFPL